jgi:uncharacterized alpha-E superfamily protein
MPTECFELINDLYYRAKDHAQEAIKRGPRHDLLEGMVSSCQLINGLLAGCMSRDEAYSFVRLGRSLERADMTTRIVDAGTSDLLSPDEAEKKKDEGSAAPFENILWMNVLRSQSAYQMYRQHVRERIRGEDVVRFLLQDEQFPRAAAHNLTTLTKVLQKLPNSGKVKWQVDKTRRMVRNQDMQKLLDKGLLNYIDDLQREIAVVHFKIASTWFLPVK